LRHFSPKLEKESEYEELCLEKVTAVVCLSLCVYVYFAMKVGFGRRVYGVKPPGCTGEAQWERFNRIHLNTLEQYMIFIPSVYGFGFYVDPNWAAGIGLVLVMGRIFFYFGYKKEPLKRMPGVLITSAANYTLLLGTLFACLKKIF
jgi:uncharacterized membrane protein YecN with MAPEG domain